MANKKKVAPEHLPAAGQVKQGAKWQVGDWVWPYKAPQGTKAVQVEAFMASIVFTTDGESMHCSHLRAAPANGVK